MTTPRPARRPRRQLHRASQIAIPMLGVTAVAALCAASPAQPVQLSAFSSAAATQAAPGQDGTMAFTYTGHTQTVTVPDDAGWAQVTVAGASGANGQVNKWFDGKHGYGVKLSGRLPVKPGDVLTIAVGGAGANPNGNKNPGDGGWSIAPYAGGGGGRGHGLDTTDGGGGGGASVIQLNGTTVVAAAGGGGEGGETIRTVSPTNYTGGGNGGVDHGAQGNYYDLSGDVGGLGGSSSQPSLNPAGGSWTSGAPAGGGGGGGGGYYPGGGGKTSTWEGSGAGGGGASLRDDLQSPSTAVLTSPGDGSVTVTWLPAPGAQNVYAFQKTDAPLTQLLEVHGAVTGNGGTVDTWQRALTSDNKIQLNEQWTYWLTRPAGFGQIVSNNSGKCLEVNGLNGNIDQWPCLAGARNEQWKLVPNAAGGAALQIDLTGPTYGHWPAGTYYLASTVDPASITDGTPLTLATTQNDKTAWDALHINP